MERASFKANDIRSAASQLTNADERMQQKVLNRPLSTRDNCIRPTLSQYPKEVCKPGGGEIVRADVPCRPKRQKRQKFLAAQSAIKFTTEEPPHTTTESLAASDMHSVHVSA